MTASDNSFTNDSSGGSSQDDNDFETKLWRGAFLPALTTGVISGVSVTIWRGKSAALASVFALILVFIFFSVHLLVARISKNAEPMFTMFLAMFSYFAKVLLLGILLFFISKFTDANSVDRTSFGICAILIILAWLVGEVRAFLKLRLRIQP